MSDTDMDVRRFACLLDELEAHLPISDAFEAADPQKVGRWWTSQKEHMRVWFHTQATTGSGAFTRQQPNLSAKTAYNRLQSPDGLLWIAEALGADRELVEAVAEQALKVPRASRSAFIRKNLPWNLIIELATRQQESRRRWARRGLVGLKDRRFEPGRSSAWVTCAGSIMYSDTLASTELTMSWLSSGTRCAMRRSSVSSVARRRPERR